MPVLEPLAAPERETQPQEAPFRDIREYVRRHGDTESVRILRDETVKRVHRFNAEYFYTENGEVVWTY